MIRLRCRKWQKANRLTPDTNTTNNRRREYCKTWVLGHIDERFANKMKTEAWFLKTEKLLNLLWVNKERIARLEVMEKLLLESIFSLETSLDDFKRIPGLTAKYGLVSGIRRMGEYDYSDLMEEYENQLESITKQLVQKHRRLVGIRYRLYNLREQIAPIEAAVRRLSAEEQTILEQKFVFRKSNYHTASLLHCSEKRVRYIYEKTIHHLAQRTGKVGGVKQQSDLSCEQAVVL